MTSALQAAELGLEALDRGFGGLVHMWAERRDRLTGAGNVHRLVAQYDELLEILGAAERTIRDQRMSLAARDIEITRLRAEVIRLRMAAGR